MVRIRTISLAALCAALALALPNVSHAQPTPAPRLTRPPRLTRFVEATWPAGAREAGRRATVVLRLTISATGTVDAAEVTESGGADFDAAAVEAARRFVFEPAEVDGRPSAIRLLYRYVFTVREEAPTTARFEGVVRTRNGRRPVAGVEVTIDGVGRATTDAEGRFVFESVAPGTRRVSLAGERLAPQEVSETFEAGRRVNATYEVSLRAVVSRGEDGVDAGAADDLRQAKALAKRAIEEWGMGVAFSGNAQPEACDWLGVAMQGAVTLLQENSALLEQRVALLLGNTQ